jgi:single-strand DNA-binding protein
MINTLVLVGKVLEAPEIRTTAKGNTVAHLLIEADRMFRNEDGSLSSDIFDVTLWKGIAEECASVCRPGSIVGIKGRLQSTTNEHNGRQFHNVDIIAEKVTFLSERMQALEKF